MKKILVHRKNKLYALVDDLDYEVLKNYTWYCNYYKGYYNVFREENKKRTKMHRQILGLEDPKYRKVLVDHKNHNTLDNRRCNIRACNSSENQRNKIPYGTSKYLGVCLHTTTQKYFRQRDQNWKVYKYQKWKASINTNGQSRHIGLYNIEEEAAIAYDKEANKHHGEFARLNVFHFPELKSHPQNN